jgi:heat shock protein HtpX
MVPPQPHGRPRRPLPVVNHWGVLQRVIREDNHDTRRIEHKRMRQTWFQTFFGFALLGLMLAGTAYWLGGLTLLGTIGVIWLSVIGVTWFFSARIATSVVMAYKAVPGTQYGDMAIKCRDRAWALLVAHVRSHYGEHVLNMMTPPPVMLAPNKHANAFCTGRSWNNSAIVIFEGLIDSGMTEDEIVAVLAHELGHFLHGDVFIQTVASVLGAVLSLTFAGAVYRWVQPFFGRLPWLFRWPTFAMTWIGFRCAGSLVKIVQMFISRSREASADALAADITDDPCALARALKKLVAHEKKMELKEQAKQDALRISNPIKFHERHLARTCELAVLDALGLLLFVDTLETLHHDEFEKEPQGFLGKLAAWWQRLNQNHPPVKDRCEWLELAAGHTCPCPGIDAPDQNQGEQPKDATRP